VPSADGRHVRRERSRKAIEAALQRLHQGKGTHPLHAGIRVRMTKQAVAREARVSPATLYRFPDLVQRIDESIGRIQQEIRPSEQRRRETAATIAELERRVSALLAENLRLTRLLGPRASQPGAPIELDSERRRRRKAQ